MKITKFVHSCLLVEMPDPVNKTALFDPGIMSEAALDVSNLKYLDNIFITHEHADHFSMDLIKQLVKKFPSVYITAPESVVDQLADKGIDASKIQSEGVVFFESPHEKVEPIFPQPEEYGYHYLDMFTHPGDSHSFSETKDILALPVTAPWGAMITAVNLALSLKPKHIIPIHDWHWNEDARNQAYETMEKIFLESGTVFHKMQTGVPIVIE